jgi:hypothetical protein
VEAKIRLKWADVFGNVRKDLSLEELRDLQAECEEEAFGPGGRIGSQLKGMSPEAMAEAVVAATSRFVAARIAPLERRIAELESQRQ